MEEKPVIGYAVRRVLGDVQVIEVTFKNPRTGDWRGRVEETGRSARGTVDCIKYECTDRDEANAALAAWRATHERVGLPVAAAMEALRKARAERDAALTSALEAIRKQHEASRERSRIIAKRGLNAS